MQLSTFVVRDVFVPNQASGAVRFSTGYLDQLQRGMRQTRSATDDLTRDMDRMMKGLEHVLEKPGRDGRSGMLVVCKPDVVSAATSTDKVAKPGLATECSRLCKPIRIDFNEHASVEYPVETNFGILNVEGHAGSY